MDERAEILALIPARGGSKSIPRKNILPLAGKPLIAYSIEQARAAQHITRVIVSTDDEEIARVAREHGAEVPFMRPSEFAQDLSPDIDVFRHTLIWLRHHEAYVPELVVHLRATGPVRRVELIDEAIERMVAHPEADSLRSISSPIQTPYKMWRIEEGYLQPLMTVDGLVESYCMPRQMLPPVYWQNGYVDIVRARIVLEQGLMCGHTILPFITNEPMLEIDYAESLPVVEEALLRLQRGEPLETPHEKRHPV
jgi:CMP-N,N'-diacetyllegionaminic acid synthase